MNYIQIYQNLINRAKITESARKEKYKEEKNRS